MMDTGKVCVKLMGRVVKVNQVEEDEDLKVHFLLESTLPQGRPFNVEVVCSANKLIQMYNARVNTDNAFNSYRAGKIKCGAYLYIEGQLEVLKKSTDCLSVTKKYIVVASMIKEVIKEEDVKRVNKLITQVKIHRVVEEVKVDNHYHVILDATFKDERGVESFILLRKKLDRPVDIQALKEKGTLMVGGYFFIIEKQKIKDNKTQSHFILNLNVVDGI